MPPKNGFRSLWISVTRIRPPREQARDPAGAGAVQRLDEDRDVGRPQRVEVDRPTEEPLVARRTGRTARRARRPRRRRSAGARSRRRRWPRSSPRGRTGSPRPAAAPVGALTLKPLSVHGLWEAVITIPAAAPRWTTSYELIWVGTAAGRERDGDVVGEEDLGGRGREVLRGEPPVEGDDDALRLLAAPDDVAGDAVGAATDVLEREVVGDPGPPAVGAEDDRRRGRGLGDDRHARTSSWRRGRAALARRRRAWRAPARCSPDAVGRDRSPRRPRRRPGPSSPSPGRTRRSSGRRRIVSPGWTTPPWRRRSPPPAPRAAPSSCRGRSSRRPSRPSRRDGRRPRPP